MSKCAGGRTPCTVLSSTIPYSPMLRPSSSCHMDGSAIGSFAAAQQRCVLSNPNRVQRPTALLALRGSHLFPRKDKSLFAGWDALPILDLLFEGRYAVAWVDLATQTRSGSSPAAASAVRSCSRIHPRTRSSKHTHLEGEGGARERLYKDLHRCGQPAEGPPLR